MPDSSNSPKFGPADILALVALALAGVGLATKSTVFVIIGGVALVAWMVMRFRSTSAS